MNYAEKVERLDEIRYRQIMTLNDLKIAVEVMDEAAGEIIEKTQFDTHGNMIVGAGAMGDYNLASGHIELYRRQNPDFHYTQANLGFNQCQQTMLQFFWSRDYEILQESVEDRLMRKQLRYRRY